MTLKDETTYDSDENITSVESDNKIGSESVGTVETDTSNEEESAVLLSPEDELIKTMRALIRTIGKSGQSAAEVPNVQAEYDAITERVEAAIKNESDEDPYELIVERKKVGKQLERLKAKANTEFLVEEINGTVDAMQSYRDSL